MFERLVVRPQYPLEAERQLDLGALVEGALFYGRTELVLSPSTVRQLTKTWGTDGILEFLDSGAIDVRYQLNFSAIHTTNAGSGRERHSPVVFDVSATEGGEVSPELLIRRVLTDLLQREGKARRLTSAICKRLKVERLDNRISKQVTQDLLDKPFVQRAALRVIQMRAPELRLPPGSVFEVDQVEDGLRVLTNIDFNAVNAVFALHTPPSQATLSPAFILSHVLAARELLEDAARSGADMVAEGYVSRIAEARVETSLSQYDRNAEQIGRFQEFALSDARAIREAVNDGRVTLKEILRLLSSASRFRHFLTERAPDSELVREYFREVTKESWVDRLPSKTLRWLLFSGAGLVLDASGAGGLGTLGGLALGGVDSLLLDSILKGWKPNQFVEGQLKPFVQKGR
jgi:hypothetical protein